MYFETWLFSKITIPVKGLYNVKSTAYKWNGSHIRACVGYCPLVSQNVLKYKCNILNYTLIETKRSFLQCLN